jgi:nitroimidazol reductase NimA-like FMN-containing flavoprotein (pyridoxamine 5'-phosphate oxidase superfamily)
MKTVHAAPRRALVSEPLRDCSGELDTTTCWELLATQSVGRVAYTEHALPAIRPVTYTLYGRHIVFCTAPGFSLAHGVTGRVVAFEVDHIDHATATGWSIVATGIARPLHPPANLTARDQVHWGGGHRQPFLTITPAALTGRALGHLAQAG